MNYKRITKENYTLHLIDTDRFKSIDIVINFTKKFNKEDINYISFLTSNLTYSTKKYNTKNKIATHGEELYGSSIRSGFEINGALETFYMSTNFLNPKYTEDKYYYESVDFLFEALLNPNVKENKFNSKYFNIIKNDIITSIKARKDNSNRYANIEFSKIMYKGTPKEYADIPTLEDTEKINESNLYKFYKTLFDGSYKIDVIVLGEIDETKIPYLEDKLKVLKGNFNKLNIFPNNNKNTQLIEKENILHFNQSILYMGYKLNNLTDHELKYTLRVFNTILGTMNDSILFNIVREANSLCYSVNSYYLRYHETLVVYSAINKTNYKKAVKLIKECINNMSDIKIINEKICAAKKTLNTYLNGYYDDAYGQIHDKFLDEFEKTEDIETIREILNSITPEEVVAISDKIKLSVIYLLKGDN